MEKLILTDPMKNPDDKVLETVLGKAFKIYQEFKNKTAETNLVLEWNYYNDQKSWLCKVMQKKKNYCWVSIWDTGFKLTFYFSEKTIEGVYELDIDSDVKKAAMEMKPVGKLRPMVLLIGNKKIMNDAMKILNYKIGLK